MGSKRLVIRLAAAACGAVLLGLRQMPASSTEPVQLGTHAQLVVDDALIASKQGVVRRAHACRKLPKPVIEAEKRSSTTSRPSSMPGSSSAG